jgi:hypothetical protein
MSRSVRTRVTWHDSKITATEKAGLVSGITAAIEHLLGEAVAIVPLEEATLQRSGVASVDRSSLTGAVSFDTPYAVRQHEDLTFRHDPGRQAKYLEQPAIQERDTMLALMAASMRRALR